MCDNSVGDDVSGAFIMTCGELEIDRWVLVDEMSIIIGAGGIWKNVPKRGKWHCCWENMWRELVTQ